MTTSLSAVEKNLIVVDATVEHQRQAQVAVHHGLGAAGGQVDDRQSAMAQGDRAVRDDAVGIGSSGLHGTRHPGHRGDVRRAPVEADLAAYTAHTP